MVQAIRISSILVKIIGEGQTKKINIKNILYMHNIKKNFFSMNKLNLHIFKVKFDINRYILKKL